MSFPAYTAYKDSGVEWLGDVPAHWTLHKLKHIARFSGGGTPSRDNLIYWNGNIPWISPKDMKVELIISAEESITAEGLQNSTTSLVPPGAILIVVRSGILKHTIPAAINKVEVALNQDMKALRFDPKLAIGKFFLRWIQGFNDQLLHAWLKQGATVESIEQDYLSDTTIPLPDFSEQRKIVNFLDHETARIDALIEEQQRLIELLKEKRQAVISHAVTKGLDPTVPMKDSGVEWLGEVPAHWVVGPLRWYATIQGGIAKGKDYEGRETVSLPYLRVANVQNGFVDLTEVKEISVLESEIGRYSLRSGDVLMNEGGDNDKLGRGTVWQGQIEPCLHQNHVFAIRPNDLLSAEWLTAFTQCDQARSYFFLNSKQSTNLASISASNVMSLALPIPSVIEQKEILSSLNQSRVAHEELVNLATSTIEFLKERRSALISAAVTGKIDVRGWQPPASATSPELAQEAV
jgi:type I restriction enzyme S subunit